MAEKTKTVPGNVMRGLPQEEIASKSRKIAKTKKVDSKLSGVENRELRPLQVPLSITMPPTNRESSVFSPSCAESSVTSDQAVKKAKFTCPGRSISSKFKVTTVPPSMIFKATSFGFNSTNLVNADESHKVIPGIDKANCDTVDEDSCLNDICCSPRIGVAQAAYENSRAKFHFLFGSVILQLKHPASFPFCGQLQVEVIKGAVEILGYILTPTRGSQIVFCPRGSCLLPIQTVAAQHNELCNLSCLDVDATIVAPLFESGGKHDAWLLLRKVESNLPSFLDRYVPFKLFPTPEMVKKEENFSKASRKLHCLFGVPSGSSCFEKGDEWDGLHEYIHKSDCTVLCGGKGVGKSTMLRFLVNQLLNKGHEHVALLDFDPGQAELTVPGCVSASVVSKPLLGPNFTHLQKTERCIYIGEVNVSNCVSRYIDACTNIISFWRSESSFTNMPCIVNTMGFSKGLGVTLMVHLLSLLKPSFVIQIQSERASQNYPDFLSVDFVKRNCSTSPFSSGQDAHLFSLGVRPVFPRSISYDLHVLNSVLNKHREKALGPRSHREIVVLSYLSQAVPSPGHSILDHVPFSCPLDALYLNICHENVDPSLTLSVMNGSLVALCNTNHIQDAVQACDVGVSAIVTRPIIANCYGFGVVRGVDMDTKYIYISTPLNSDAFININCLVLGAVNLPSALLLNPPNNSGSVPYTTVVRSTSNGLIT